MYADCRFAPLEAPTPLAVAAAFHDRYTHPGAHTPHRTVRFAGMFGSELDANGHKLELPLLDPRVSRGDARALGSAPVFLIVGLVLLLLLPSP